MSKNEQQARDADEQARLELRVRQIFEQDIRFNAFLGCTVDALNADQVALGFAMRAELVGHYLHGRLHGGVISSVLDACGGLAVMWQLSNFHAQESVNQVLERFAHLGTIDLRVDYLRQGIGERFVATAYVLRLGRRVANTRMELHNEKGVLLASGSATYIVS